MEMNRRDAVVAMMAFASLGMLAEAQGSSEDDAALKVSKVFRFDAMKVSNFANGGWGRAVMHGTLPTGEFVEVHETMLPAGQMPHPAHKHSHSEFLLIREGDLQYQDEDKWLPVGPGDVVFSAHNRLHGLKNVGTTPARYFVVAVGVQKAE